MTAVKKYSNDADRTSASLSFDIFATRSDFMKARDDLIKWIVGTSIAMATAAITVMAFVLNNATHKQAAAQPLPPIIINVPSQQAAPAPEAPKPPTP